MSNKTKQITKDQKKAHSSLRKLRKGGSRGKLWSITL